MYHRHVASVDGTSGSRRDVKFEIRVSKSETSTKGGNEGDSKRRLRRGGLGDYDLSHWDLFRVSGFRNGAGQQASACVGVVVLRVLTGWGIDLPLPAGSSIGNGKS